MKSVEIPDIALSTRQPWAWAIFHAGKDIENRGRLTAVRGPVAIHASGTTDDPEDLLATVAMIDETRVPRYAGDLPDYGLPPLDRLPTGAIVGVVDIVDVVRDHASPWFFGPVGYVLANARPIAEPIPARGMPGFFNWRRSNA